MIRVLFVCTGNTCRSPMAEGLLKKAVSSDLEGKVEVSSAGIFAAAGSPATENAVAVLREAGVEIEEHRSTQVSGTLIEEADLIVAMTEAHAGHILSAWPAAHDRMIVLGVLDRERDDPDIRDPISGDRAVYEETRDELGELTLKLVGFIKERFPERI